MKRDTWGSRLGFIFAVAGSAVGLANIWRFPYIVGKHGGAAFIVVYLICLALMGFPVFISEMLIGRTAKSSPTGAFRRLSRSSAWSKAGSMTILTGFIVSSFYSAVAGWILGYLVEATVGNLTHFQSTEQAASHYTNLINNPWWCCAFHFFFLLACIGVLYSGVRQGIERGSKFMMPLLFLVLFILVIRGLFMEGAGKGLAFLFTPDWSVLTPAAIIVAMGQAFFTLSVGQGTLVTYGSYLKGDENLVTSSLPIVLMDTLVSILSAIAVFTIVFSVGMEPNSGPGLIFHTLPWAFSQISGGYFLALLFFLLVVLAALTSEISALEPSIAYLIDERGWKRKPAVLACGLGAFLLGIPSALSYNLLKNYTLYGMTFLDFVDFLASSILIPLGGLFAVLLVGWRWGIRNALHALKEGAETLFIRFPGIKHYFWFCIKYSAPALILFVFLNALVS
ncbi:MAG: sodium-dependent transporter [Parachlamydiaceae bacterium]|nr:sodium-dependent transporter [Parachlamydiaceae bacterium]